MLTNILYLCVGILLCFVLWRVMLGFFLAGLGVSYKIVRYAMLHYMLICIYVVFAYIMGLYCINGAIYIDMLYTQDSIFVALCCLMGFVLLHILSVLDFYTQKVPNILLAILFICANILYYVTHEVYDLYAFGVLGIVYGVYFMLHLVGNRQYMGEGDVWIIASLAVILESFFAYQISFIFEMLCVASLMGILYFYFNVWRLKRVRSSGYNVKCDNVDSIECDEISKLNDIRDFSPSARTIRKDFAHTCKNDKILESNNPAAIQAIENLDSKNFTQNTSAHNQTENNTESKSNNLAIKQIPFIPFLSLSFLCVSAYHVA